MRQLTDLEFNEISADYRRLFNTAPGQRVLKDLAEVCHAASTTYDPCPREHARKEGKRQLFLRIQNMMSAEPIKKDENS